MTQPIVHLCNTPSPYRNAEWDIAATELGVDRVGLIFADSFFHTACWEPSFPKICPYHTIGGTAEQHGISLGQLPALLDRLNPRVVILSGYRSAPYRIARRWCRQRGVGYCLRSDGNVHKLDLKGRWNARALLRWFLLSRFVRHADQCLITGTSNRLYWQRFGMRPKQEGWFPQWIDYDAFESASELRRTKRDELRQRFGIRPPITLFTAGRIIPLKRVELLCEALLRLDDRVGLVVAGRGSEEELLRQRYQERLGDRLMFVGSIEPEDLPKWYAATDIYALASGPSEAWGQVLVEAAAGGMPIVAHRLAGASFDLVADGVNGFVLDTFEASDWCEVISRFVDNPSLIESMGAESSRIGKAWRAQGHPTSCLKRLLEAYPD